MLHPMPVGVATRTRPSLSYTLKLQPMKSHRLDTLKSMQGL